MNSSQSLPTFPRFQASTGPTVSSGGSVQSHLSSLTGSTQRRLRLPDPGPPRIHVHPPSPDRKTRPKQVAEKFNAPVQNLFFRTQLQTRFVRWPSILRLREGQSTASRASIMSVRLVILAYCAFSMLLFTATLFGYIGVEPDILQADVSPIRLVPRSLPQRSTSLHPAPLALNSLKTQSNDMTWAAEDLSPSFSTPRLTACVWAPESEIGLFANWSTQWPGIVSLLVTTVVHSSNLTAYGALVDQLTMLATHLTSNSRQRLDAHILSVQENTLDAPNTYLNLAHLLAYLDDASSTHHVLFPAGLSISVTTIHDTFLNHALRYPREPALLVPASDHPPSTTPPLPGLAPLLIPAPSFELTQKLEDELDSGWCPERLLPPIDRATDWALCVRTVWLRTYGRLAYVHPPPNSEWVYMTGAATQTSMSRINDRLAGKFAEEACVLAAKHLEALHEVKAGEKEKHKKIDTSEARWLREACHETLTGWGKGII